MQFKYPELFWALFLLLIPVFIHLFQLRRFKKTPFTNVKLLQKVVSESRKSNNLKKWLLLAARLLLFAALVFAFAQPFLANETALKKKETVIYLDDSFSMQAKTNKGSLLNIAIQELIKSVPEEETISLFTNTTEYRNSSLKDIQNELLAITQTPKQLSLEEVSLKANSLFSKNNAFVKNLILISDFQEKMGASFGDSINTIQNHIVQLKPESVNNIVLDSIYVNSSSNSDNIELTALLSTNYEVQSIPVSLYGGNKLISKTSAALEDNKGEVTFTLPSNEVIKGRIEITDSGLAYDNHLYFNINEKEKPKVLAVGNTNAEFLSKIYTEDEFDFKLFELNNLNYQDIDSQNLIVLNELEAIPSSLIASLVSFVSGGGNLVIIPSTRTTLASYNQLFSRLAIGTFGELTNSELNITQISFSHPIYQNVFEKNINNFQYPKVNQYFKTKTFLPKILSYQNSEPFLFGNNHIYVFTASISNLNSNFKQSPLIVPTFFKMGVNSLKSETLYQTMKGNIEIDVQERLAKDRILKVSKGEYEFIPQQQSFANKVTLTFNDAPNSDGTYNISENGDTLKGISFNYPRDESELKYLQLNNVRSTSKQNSISSLFKNIEIDNSVTELWKWFVILAVLFILIEVLIIKYLK